MKLSRVMLVAACIAVSSVPHKAFGEDIDSANAVMRGCRALDASANTDNTMKGICAGTIQTLAEVGKLLNICPPKRIDDRPIGPRCHLLY
jgi:hypothetical protein